VAGQVFAPAGAADDAAVEAAAFGGGASVLEHAPTASADATNNVETFRIDSNNPRRRCDAYLFFADVFRRAAAAGRAVRAGAPFFTGFFTLAAAFARAGCARFAAI